MNEKDKKHKNIIEEIELLLQKSLIGVNPYRIYGKHRRIRILYPSIYKKIMLKTDLSEIYDIIDGKKSIQEVILSDNEKK